MEHDYHNTKRWLIAMKNIDNDALKQAIGSSGLDSATKSALSQATDSGDMSAFLSKLSPEQSRKLQDILSDEAATRRLLSTPQAQMLLKKLLKK